MTFLSEEPGFAELTRISRDWDPRSVLSPATRAARAKLETRWRERHGGPAATLANALSEGAARNADAPLLFYSDSKPGRLTLGEIHAEALIVAAGLHRLGLSEGDAIAAQLPNWPQTAVLYAAAAALGLVLIPIVSIYGPSEVGFILRQSGARALVMPSRYRRIDAVADIPRLGETPELRHLIVIGEEAPSGAISWEELTRQPDDGAGFPAPRGEAGGLSLIVYTSGTTAEPKGVQHSHESVLAEMVHGPTPPPGVAGTVNLQPFPAGHTAGLMALLSPYVHGYPTIVMDTWDAEACAGLIAEHRVTAMAGTPFLLSSMLDAAESGGHDVTSLRHGITGGAGVPPALIERAEEIGWRLGRCYGSTEQPSTTGCMADDPLWKRAHTDGRTLGENLIRIVDEEGGELPRGEEGEIASAGPEQFIAYTDPALNETAFLADGWLLTGDVGRIDEDGYLTITDRRKDIIIRGGENISSQEVEDLVLDLAAVAETAVVAAPDPRYGERVCAFVVLRPGASLSLESVLEHFAGAGVARHKTPERLELVSELPRTPAGKVKKHELRRRLGTG
jgi:acyl-CoA synthetase (AMP-forming)/AMP-acid ligase II